MPRLNSIDGYNNEIFKKKLAYYQHVLQMHEDRSCKIAYEERLSWGIQDNSWDNRGVRTQTNIITKNKFWLNELYNMASTAKIDLLVIGTLVWKSQDFKIFFEGKRNKELTVQIAEHIHHSN